MFFILDGILVALILCVFWFGVKKGLSGNWIFNILRTLISFGGAAGAAVGLYFLMDNFGWLTVMSDGVVSFFGNIKVNLGLTQQVFIEICRIVAFIPFAILFAILGYVLTYWLLGILLKVLSVPLNKLRQYTLWRVIDNLLGCAFNLAIVGGITLGLFGVIHTLNAGDTYKHVLGENSNANVNHSIEVILDGMHENISAGVVSGFLYEYNPLNDVFQGMF